MIPIIALISVAFAGNPINWTVPGGITCPEEAAFVCGNNGKNYHNECVAKANGIVDFSDGRCPEPPRPVPCAGVAYAPVCDAVKKTYPNKCLAEIRGGVAPFAKGSCAPALVGCTKEYKPVVGADGKTYSNKCLANAALVCSLGFKTDDKTDVGKFGFVEEVPFVQGSGSCATSLVNCVKKVGLENLKPVCGAKRKTYPNKCLANAAGVTSFRPCSPIVIRPTPALSHSKN
jgi:hypothetical protein